MYYAWLTIVKSHNPNLIPMFSDDFKTNNGTPSGHQLIWCSHAINALALLVSPENDRLQVVYMYKQLIRT